MKVLAITPEEAASGVQKFLTGVRSAMDMDKADDLNPHTLPPELEVSVYSLEDLQKATHRPEAVLGIEGVINQRSDTTLLVLSKMITLFTLSVCHFRFCFKVPDDCTLSIHPLAVKAVRGFHYFGIALALKPSSFVPLLSKISMETEVRTAIQNHKNYGHGLVHDWTAENPEDVVSSEDTNPDEKKATNEERK